MNNPYSRKYLHSMSRQAFIAFTVFLSLVFCLDIPETYSEEASESYVFERMWPTLPQPWYFSPSDIALDNDGNIYIADPAKDVIHKFNTDGNFITKWGSEGSDDGQFARPQGVAVDSDGNVYVADTYNSRIQKFDSFGNFITKWELVSGDASFSQPSAIAVDRNGNIYVDDSWNNRIQKFDSEGNLITMWGSGGSGDGQFHSTTIIAGIAVDSAGNVYVADDGNYRIQKFDSDGNFIIKWGSRGFGNGQFEGQGGIAVDSAGNVYVGGVNNRRIQKFDSDGNFIIKWGSYGRGDGQFYSTQGVAVDSAGNVYVGDGEDNRIQKFDSDGNFITKWGNSGIDDGMFNYPGRIAVDSDGNVYVADRENDRIQKFDSDGNFKWGSKGSGDDQFWKPNGIAVDNGGNVYVTDRTSSGIYGNPDNDRTSKLDSDGNFITKWETGSGDERVYFPGGIAVDSDGNVYEVSGDSIYKFDSDGNFITKWGITGSGYAGEIAVDSAGNVYVYVKDQSGFSVYNPRIQKYDSDGNFKTKWGSEGSGDGQFHPAAGGIAVDNIGNVYVADSWNHRIQKFDSDGNFITKTGTLGSTPGQFVYPYDLDIGTNGNLYVADTVNNRIQVLKSVTVVPGVSERKAIVVAGGGPFAGNSLWDTTQMLANYAYKTLTFQGYTKETIYYISADTDLDLDGNGILDDVDADATNANLEDAITAWALDADDVVVYLANHGGDGTFRMSGTEIMSATELDSWLDILQGSITGKLTVIYDACESGSFLDVLTPSSDQERILVMSTSPGENAYFVSKGTVSFSFFFWGHVFGGTNIYDTFTLSSNAISFSVEGQTPLLDDNGNGIGNEKEDGLVAIDYFIGNGTEMGGDIPFIGSVSPGQVLDGVTTALIWVDGIVTTGTIEKVWAVIKTPDSIPGSPDIPITDLPLLNLKDAGGGRYEGTYDDFLLYGAYNINIYAKDTNGNISMPKTTNVYQQDGIIAPTPDIQANGSDGPVTPIDDLSITVALDSGSSSGTPADWWILANTPFGWIYLSTSGWALAASPFDALVALQIPLVSFSSTEILKISVASIPSGTYTFYFAIDTTVNGVLDSVGLAFDSVTVVIP